MVVGYQHFRKPSYRLGVSLDVCFFCFFLRRLLSMLEARRITCKRCRELGSGSPIDRAVEQQHELVVLFHCLVKLFNTWDT